MAMAGWEVTSELVRRKRALRKEARRAVADRIDVIVTVGGDGAVGQVATVVSETRTALAIVPTGTGNLLAGNLGIPDDPASAVEAIVRGRRRRIDVGRISIDGIERVFTVACGIGYDAAAMDATTPEGKLRWGRLAYVAGALGRTGALENVRHDITLDGVAHRMDAAQLFIANFGRMLPIVEPRRKIRGDDGLLDVIVVRAGGPLAGLVAAWEALVQTDLGESTGGHVFRAQAREIEVRTRRSRLVEGDGSVLGNTPIRVTVQPRALTVIVPRQPH